MNKIIFEIFEEINRINQNKADQEFISARVLMTRHELKVQVFDNSKNDLSSHINTKIRYFNDEKNHQKLVDLVAQLKKLQEDLK